MGLVSIDPLQIKIILETDAKDAATPEEQELLASEKKYATKLLPILQQRHFLLVSLLLFNALANEALPIFLDAIVPSWMAIVISVTMVLIFSEILPSAIFTGSHALQIGATLSWFVWVIMITFGIISWPASKLLDCIFGSEHGLRYRRSELKALVKIHKNDEKGSSTAFVENFGGLSNDEVTIIHGVLDMQHTCVKDVMTPLEKTFMVESKTVLDQDMMASILARGYSRIPVYEETPHNVRGILLVKQLIVINSDDKRVVNTLGLRPPLVLPPDLGLLDALNEFQRARSHMAFISNNPANVRDALHESLPIPKDVEVYGIITIEDILERLIREEIEDETDVGVRVDLYREFTKSNRLHRLTELAKAEKLKMMAHERNNRPTASAKNLTLGRGLPERSRSKRAENFESAELRRTHSAGSVLLTTPLLG
eukprot:TRINITY_DN6782_c0_g1_i1.p1 TRINITY_DN6782_c0_g1~~TRINITY_DN6782_c0_g1_i1.p1  ORF type:complete len:427 (+),score=19.86 TRINITY_DN6782_c0_g1_i1:170-1450(+)